MIETAYQLAEKVNDFISDNTTQETQEILSQVKHKIKDRSKDVEEFRGHRREKLLGAMILISIIALIIFVLVLCLGKYLWNNYLTKSVTGIKPLNSLLEFFALYVLIRILISR
jgi:hypothetical protein